MNYRICQEGFDKLSRIPALLVSGCEEPQVEEAKALAEAVVAMAQPVEQDMSNKPPSALQVGETCQTALHVGGVASLPQPEAPAQALTAEEWWIPVEERLPEVNPKTRLAIVIAATSIGSVQEMFCEIRPGKAPVWTWGADRMPTYQDVTHWQPLPKPPTRALAGAESES